MKDSRGREEGNREKRIVNGVSISTTVPVISIIRDRPLFFWRGDNCKIKCFQGLKKLKKLFANMICIKKYCRYVAKIIDDIDIF